jgi:hypothetical protein
MKDIGEKNLLSFLFFWSHKFHKIELFFIFGMLKKKIWANFLPKKLSQSSQKYGFGIRDPGSEIRDPESGKNLFRIPGSKRHRIPDPESGSATLQSKLNLLVSS